MRSRDTILTALCWRGEQSNEVRGRPLARERQHHRLPAVCLRARQEERGAAPPLPLSLLHLEEALPSQRDRFGGGSQSSAKGLLTFQGAGAVLSGDLLSEGPSKKGPTYQGLPLGLDVLQQL